MSVESSFSMNPEWLDPNVGPARPDFELVCSQLFELSEPRLHHSVEVDLPIDRLSGPGVKEPVLRVEVHEETPLGPGEGSLPAEHYVGFGVLSASGVRQWLHGFTAKTLERRRVQAAASHALLSQTGLSRAERTWLLHALRVTSSGEVGNASQLIDGLLNDPPFLERTYLSRDTYASCMDGTDVSATWTYAPSFTDELDGAGVERLEIRARSATGRQYDYLQFGSGEERLLVSGAGVQTLGDPYKGLRIPAAERVRLLRERLDTQGVTKLTLGGLRECARLLQAGLASGIRTEEP